MYWRKQILRLWLAFFALFLFLEVGHAQNTSADHLRAGKNSVNTEDWSSLSLANSQLSLLRPVPGERDELPAFTRELIQVQWRSEDPIDLYVIRPKGEARPPVILYLYSYPSETDRFRDDGYCERITHGGFAAVGFVSALTGHRYKNRPMKEWFVSELQEALGSSVHDVQMILNYLSTRDDLDMNRIGMFGAGSGGAIAILAASVDARIEAVDVLDPWGDWPGWLEKSTLIPDEERVNYLKPEFLKKVTPGLDPVDWLPKLQTQQLRIQQVFDDPITPEAAKKRIESAAPHSAEIVHFDNTREFFVAVSGGRIFQWTKDRLRPVPLAGPAAVNLGKSKQAPMQQGSAAND